MCLLSVVIDVVAMLNAGCTINTAYGRLFRFLKILNLLNVLNSMCSKLIMSYIPETDETTQSQVVNLTTSLVMR